MLTLRQTWRALRSSSRGPKRLSGPTFWRRSLWFAAKELTAGSYLTFKDQLGITYFTPPNNTSSRLTNLYGYRDESVFHFIQKHLQPGDCAIDVGANVGTYTFPFARLVGEAGRVVAYEPDPEVASLLDRTRGWGSYDQVTIRPCGVADAGGLLSLHRNYTNRGQTSTSIDTSTRGLIVTSVTLDDDVQRLGVQAKVRLIKIDVEGNEARVIAGARQLLTASSDIVVIMEHLPHVVCAEDHSASASQQLLEMGYLPFFAKSDGTLLESTSAWGDNMIWRKTHA